MGVFPTWIISLAKPADCLHREAAGFPTGGGRAGPEPWDFWGSRQVQFPGEGSEVRPSVSGNLIGEQAGPPGRGPEGMWVESLGMG